MENIIIIGAGPAGISAALYAARGNLTPLLLNNGIGALAKAEKIENYYGLERPLSGEELYERGVAQAKALGIRIIDAQVLGINGFDTFTVQTTAGNFDTVSVILATGGKRSAPNIPGIREFEGKGVSYCAICDAFFYRNRDVAVIGNSDFALHEAEELRNVTSSVTIYTNGREPEFSREHPIAVNTMKIQAIEGGDTVSGIRMEHDVASMENEDRESFYPADGVFVALGTAGSTEIARQMGAELTDKGNVRVNSEMETTIPVEMQEKYLKIISYEAERLEKLTRGLLTLNELDIQKRMLHIQPFDINSVIKATAASFEGSCTSRNILLELILSGKELMAQADMEQIQQVLYNLLSNAIKFSPDNSTITLETTEKNGKIFVSVKDHGIGIPKASLQKIWERFYKIDRSRGKDQKGTGLGLAIVKEILHAHGQHINVISTEGVGTEFIFTLEKAK